jgi:hypothetical protein
VRLKRFFGGTVAHNHELCQQHAVEHAWATVSLPIGTGLRGIASCRFSTAFPNHRLGDLAVSDKITPCIFHPIRQKSKEKSVG